MSLWPTFAAYAFFGAGYVSFMTFIIALLQQQCSSAATAATFVFGGSFMAGPSAVTLMVRRLTAPHLATAAIGAMTVAFAVGQAVGPILAGYVSDLTGTVSEGLWTAPLLLVLAAVLAPLQRNRQS